MAYKVYTKYNEYHRGGVQPTPPEVININLEQVASWQELAPETNVTPPLVIIRIRTSSGGAYTVIGPF